MLEGAGTKVQDSSPSIPLTPTPDHTSPSTRGQQFNRENLLPVENQGRFVYSSNLFTKYECVTINSTSIQHSEPQLPYGELLLSETPRPYVGINSLSTRLHKL